MLPWCLKGPNTQKLPKYSSCDESNFQGQGRSVGSYLRFEKYQNVHQIPGNYQLQPQHTISPALGSSSVCDSHGRVFFVSGRVSETWSKGMLSQRPLVDIERGHIRSFVILMCCLPNPCGAKITYLFERREFLIDTSQKKSLRVCTCARVKSSWF